jgi:hypothetical protein
MWWCQAGNQIEGKKEVSAVFAVYESCSIFCGHFGVILRNTAQNP